MTECVSKQVFDDEKCLEEFYIDELNKSPVPIKFHIPGYQRGYRWTTKNYYENNDKPGEIETLLQDLLEFANSSLGDEKLAWNNYCLQPIVLQKINNKGEYLVVDGQQRLTTLAIISHVLLNSGQTWNLGWDIVYDCEDQKKLSQCLLTPEVSSQAGKINDYFRNQALMAIEDWFKEEVKDIGQEQDRRKIIQPLFDGTSGDKHILLIKYMLPPASNAQAKGEEPLSWHFLFLQEYLY